MEWTPCAAEGLETSDLDENSSTKSMRPSRSVVLAVGICVGLVVSLSWTTLRGSLQPPVDVSPDGEMQLSSESFKDVCSDFQHWDNDLKFHFYPKTVPRDHHWSYDESSCDLDVLKDCSQDCDCAGLAGHQDPNSGSPQCWKMRMSASGISSKDDWWVCAKYGYSDWDEHNKNRICELRKKFDIHGVKGYTLGR